MNRFEFRPARREEIDALVALLADDDLGRTREAPGTPLSGVYVEAFEAIDRDPRNELIVCVQDARIVGMLQLTFIPGLTHQGRWRALIEGVRVASAMRGTGIGHALIEWTIERTRERNCRIVQLTTDKSRPEALRFYEDLGFEASHEGLKLRID